VGLTTRLLLATNGSLSVLTGVFFTVCFGSTIGFATGFASFFSTGLTTCLDSDFLLFGSFETTFAGALLSFDSSVFEVLAEFVLPRVDADFNRIDADFCLDLLDGALVCGGVFI